MDVGNWTALFDGIAGENYSFVCHDMPRWSNPSEVFWFRWHWAPWKNHSTNHRFLSCRDQPACPPFWSPLLAKSFSIIPQAPVSQRSPWLNTKVYAHRWPQKSGVDQTKSSLLQPDHLNTAGSFQHQKAKQHQKKPSENLKHPTILSQVVTVTLAKMKETSVLRPKWPEKGL